MKWVYETIEARTEDTLMLRGLCHVPDFFDSISMLSAKSSELAGVSAATLAKAT